MAYEIPTPHKARVLDIKRASEKSSLGPVGSHNRVENTIPIAIWFLNNRAQGAILTRGEIELDCVAVVLTRSRIGKRDAEIITISWEK